MGTNSSDVYRRETPEEFDKITSWYPSNSPTIYDYYQQAMADVRYDTSQHGGNNLPVLLIYCGAPDR